MSDDAPPCAHAARRPAPRDAGHPHGLPRSQHGEHSEALFLTTAYVQADAETSARKFANSEDFTYSRTSNPTVRSLEARMAALEGTEAAIATSTGMSAILLLAMGLLKAGDHVICSRSVFGSTINLVRQGVRQVRGRDHLRVADRPGRVARGHQADKTKLFFAETPTNPLTEICDIRALADLAHDAGALLAVDNTYSSRRPCSAPPRLGADVVMHSATKYMDGQGRVMAGRAVRPEQAHPRRLRPRAAHRRHDAGPVQRLGRVLKGLETLSLRMKAQSEQALAVARWLEAQPEVAQRLLPRPGVPPAARAGHAPAERAGRGGAVVRPVKADSPEAARAAAFHVIDSTRVVSIATNLGDTKTIITHPATTSHGRLSEAQRQAAGIGQGLIRLAVGLEHVDDITDDLQRGLSTLNTR